MDFDYAKELRRFCRFALINLLICLAAYQLLISNELVNTYDALWSGAEYRNYLWVIEIGRWLWPAVGLAQMNICPEPFTSILALSFFVLGSCAVAFWLGVKDSARGYLLVLTSVISTAVCADLSHRYMSPVFGLSFLLSVLAAWMLSREKTLSWLASVLCLTFALGLYQANIGCACVLVLVFLIRLLQDGAETRKVFGFLGRTVSSFLCSFIIYKLIWDLALNLCHVEASSYRGGGDASVLKIITSLPVSIKKVYLEFYRYFFENELKYHVYQRLAPFRLMLVCLLAVTVILIGRKLWSRPLGAKLGAMGCLLLIPPAANVAQILSVDTLGTSIQMTLPMATVFPFLLCVADSVPLMSRPEAKRNWLGLVSGFRALCMIVLLGGSLMMISTDQHVMLKSRETAVNMMNRIVGDLGEDTNPEGGVFFIGRPSDNPIFLKDQLWERSNDYAHYGEFWLGGSMTIQSYFGYVRDTGVLLNFNWNADTWNEIKNREDVKAMPVYPDDGYIRKIGNAMVVKLS